MGKKSKSFHRIEKSESDTPPILEIGFSDPLFTVAAHPTQPIIISGLGTGHVFCHKYDPGSLEFELDRRRSDFLSKEKSSEVQLSLLKKKWWRSETDHAEIGGDDSLGISWKTKRHKGSCRSVIFDTLDGETGENVFTVGTDNILKKAKTETGKVHSKIDLSSHLDTTPKDAITTMAMSVSNSFLASGTENGNVFVFDSNNLSAGKLKFKLNNVQEDAVNKILPMPAISDYHFLALGSTRLAHIDIRKGVVTQSDDQADELLSMCYPTEFVNANKNDTVVVTHGEGIITLWRNSTNGFSDQISRVKVNKNASIDAIISTMNSGDDDAADSVWCGDSDGRLHRVNYKRGKIMETRVHSSFMSKSGAVDEVNGLDIDFEYRLVSSGMEGLKIWSGKSYEGSDFSEEDSESDDFSSSDETESSDGIADEDSSIDGADQEESSPRDDIERESSPKKRGNKFTAVQPNKKERIDIRAFAKNKASLDVKSNSESAEGKKSYTKQQPTKNIARFDGL